MSDERYVTLESGGIVHIVLDFNLGDLTVRDREFVFGVIDAVQAYEATEHALCVQDWHRCWDGGGPGSYAEYLIDHRGAGK